MWSWFYILVLFSDFQCYFVTKLIDKQVHNLYSLVHSFFRGGVQTKEAQILS